MLQFNLKMCLLNGITISIPTSSELLSYPSNWNLSKHWDFGNKVVELQ